MMVTAGQTGREEGDEREHQSATLFLSCLLASKRVKRKEWTERGGECQSQHAVGNEKGLVCESVCLFVLSVLTRGSCRPSRGQELPLCVAKTVDQEELQPRMKIQW